MERFIRSALLIGEDNIQKLALEHKPKLIVAGASAYPRKIDFILKKSVASRTPSSSTSAARKYSPLMESFPKNTDFILT